MVGEGAWRGTAATFGVEFQEGAIPIECGFYECRDGSVTPEHGVLRALQGVYAERFFITPGIRVEENEYFGQFVNPKVSSSRFRGHQFRYSELRLKEDVECSYTVRRHRGGEALREGYRIGNMLASYVHAHWASNPLMAEGFVQACSAQARRSR